MTYTSILETLRTGSWFRSLPAHLQDLIVCCSLIRAYARGEPIVTEGAPAEGMFAVLEGHVRVMRRTADAHEVLLHVGEAGFWFGDYGTMAGAPSVGSVVADASVRALFLSVPQFEHIVKEEPRYFRAFAGLLFERYALLFRYMGDAHSLAREQWLHVRLADMAAMQRGDSPHSDAVSIALSQADLASMIGVSRQTLNSLLHRLEARGLIEVGYRSVRVLDEDSLRNSGLQHPASDAAVDR
jgi:CRP-like cAMP-binding protein